MNKSKHFYVPWEGYQEGQADRKSGHHLDTLCLQGPYTREEAERIAHEIRSVGFRASIIDCSDTLRLNDAAPDLLEALKQLRDAMIRYMAGSETHLYEITQANAAISKAEKK